MVWTYLTVSELGLNSPIGLMTVVGMFVVAAIICSSFKVCRKVHESFDIDLAYSEIPPEQCLHAGIVT